MNKKTIQGKCPFCNLVFSIQYLPDSEDIVRREAINCLNDARMEHLRNHHLGEFIINETE